MTQTLEVSTSDLHKFIEGAKSAKYLVVDTEGNGKDVRDRSSGPVTMGVTLTYRDKNFIKQSYYFAFQHIIGDNQPEFFSEVCELLRIHPCLIFHNAKHDIVALELWDIYRRHGFYCTMIMLHLINENLLSYSLDSASRLYGGEPKAMTPLLKRIIEFMGWGHIPVDMMRKYSIQDGDITLDLFEKIHPEFCAQGYDGKYWYDTESWIWTISQMEKCGIKIDNELCEREIEKATKILKELKENLGGMNPLSPKDLYELLIVKLKLPIVKRTEKGQPSFDKEAMALYQPMLEKINSPVAKHVIRYRGWNKVKSTNYEPYLRLQGKDGRLRPNYNLHRAKTRRLSCGSNSDGKTEVKSPNLQNVPRASEKEWDGDLKAAFIAEEDYTLWDIDQSQAEMRVSTAYSADPKLIEIFNSDVSLFDQMAEDLGWLRQDVKTFMYATGYGAQDQRIADTFKIELFEANGMRSDFDNTYSTYVALKKFVAGRAEKQRYIKYWTGARRHFKTPREAKHLSFNSLMQGGVAELIKYNAIEIAEIIDWDTCKMLLQVHDSLDFEIKNGHEDYWLPKIKKIMETPPPLFVEKTLVEVPFKVDIKKWGTEEKWQIAV